MSRVMGFLFVLIAATLPWSGGEAATPVDLELVIATDVSRSIDHEEGQLQRQGFAAALRSGAVVEAIGHGFLGRIGVAYIDFSTRPHNRVVVDWRVIHDQASADGFSRALLAAPANRGLGTSISDAIEEAVALIEANDLEGTRRVIDVAADGPNNAGRLVDAVRDETVARRITINGLPILNDARRFNPRYNLEDLHRYFEGCVIGGTGAFIVVAGGFADFARAIRRKLLLEIAGPVPHAQPLLRRVASVRPVYERGCDIGERLRGAF